MSQRCEIDNVVYYYEKVICPACKGAKMLLRDNREDLDFSVSYLRPLSEMEHSSDIEPCKLCDGVGEVEKIDYKSMTPKQIKIYEAFKKDLEKL